MRADNFRTLVVANPLSANGALGRRWSDLQQVIEHSFGSFDHRFTSKQGDATTLTRQALQEDGYEMVVAMGGDGTISEVVDGFFTAEGAVQPEAVLGVLPYGTGGDFRKTIKAPRELGEGAQGLTGKQTQSIDVGRLTYTDYEGAQRVRHFINIASFGVSGLVDQLVNESSKALGGMLSFARATFIAMARYRPKPAMVRLDDRLPEEVMFHTIAVANGRYFGGGMQIAPWARLDDGLFDVVFLENVSVKDLLLSGYRLYLGTHLSLPGVRSDRARRVEAHPVNPLDNILLDVDGETPGKLPATFEILADAILLKTP